MVDHSPKSEPNMKKLFPINPLKPPSYTGAACLRRLSADAEPSPPPSRLPSEILASKTFLSFLTPLSVLKLARRLPNYQNALQFFNHLKSIAILPDSLPLAFQAVLELALRENPGSPGKLYELFLLARDQNVPLSVKAATLLIKCFSEAGMLDEMMLVFDAIDGEVVNTNLLNSVVAGLLKWDRFDRALKLLDEMLEPDSCCPPNSSTAGVVFHSILKRGWRGRNVTAEEICRLISKFGDHGVAPRAFWFRQIIMRFCRDGETDKAWSLLHEVMDLGADLDVSCCNPLLMRLGQDHDFTRLNLLMKEMKGKGIEPDAASCGIMIKHLCKSRRIDEAMEVFNEMKEGWLGVEPDLVIYNTLIDGLCKVGRQEEGLGLLMRMIDAKCKPNTVAYKCLIDGFCKVGEIETGHELLKQMSKEGVEVNITTVNILLDAMCKHRRVGSAMKLFDSLQEKGLKPDSVTYTILLTALCNGNNIKDALILFDDMCERGYSPGAGVYYSLISGLTQAGKMDDATFVVSRLKEAGFCLDASSCNILINEYYRNNRSEKASEMLKDMEDLGLKV